MNLLLSLLYLFLCTEVIAFQNYPYSKIHKSIQRNTSNDNKYKQTSSHIQIQCSTTERYTNIILRTSADDNDNFDVFNEDLDETILRINFSYEHNNDEDDDKGGSAALSSIQDYTRSFPFAAVLPVQPLTYLPVKIDTSASRSLVVPTDSNIGLKVTFLRKKTAEKGSQDGGILFSSCLVSEEDMDEDGEMDNYKKKVQLTAWRLTEGQTVSKYFSEKQIVLAFVKGLIEGKGKELLDKGGVELESVFHLWM